MGVHTIKKLTIEGFKSIRKLEDFELRSLNVLIGANGAGKSNFVSLFRLLREIIDQRLQLAVETGGGADAFLYLGPKITKHIIVKLSFGGYGYEFTLIPTNDNRLVFADEATDSDGVVDSHRTLLGTGQREALLKDRVSTTGVPRADDPPSYVFNAMFNWVVYHFHDTSDSSGARRWGPINDNERLRPDASNLAAFLYRIQKTSPDIYAKIRDVVRLAAPFFDDLRLRPVPDNQEMIQLEWAQKGSDYLMRPSQLSDGTLRFICLAVALLQPSLPGTVVFDEPELGLHPYALTLLASLFQQAGALGHQVIISTQSAGLLNNFAPEDVVVVERSQGQSVFHRLDSSALSEWLKEYSLGELWQKNIIGGRPRAEGMALPLPKGNGNGVPDGRTISGGDTP
jgi:predicted ATPase